MLINSINISNLLYNLFEKYPKLVHFLLYQGIYYFLILILLIALDQLYSKKSTLDSNQNKLTEMLFILFIIVFFIIFKSPFLILGYWNPDEAQHIGSYWSLKNDLRFFLSAESGTAGPLISYFIFILDFINIEVDLSSTKLLTCFIWVAYLILFYKIFTEFFGNGIAKILLIPVIFAYFSFHDFDYICYNSEHLSILLLIISIYLISKINFKKLIFWKSFFIGMILCLIFFSKIQAIPMGLVIGFFFIILSYKQPKNIIFLTLGILSVLILFATYLFIYDLFTDFYNSYILTNILYVPNGKDFVLKDYINESFQYLIMYHESRVLIQKLSVFIPISLIFYFFLKKYLKKEKQLLYNKWLFFFFVLLIASIYSVIKPKNYFGHYTLYLIPTYLLLISFLFGILLSFIYEHYTKKKMILISIGYFIALGCLCCNNDGLSAYEKRMSELYSQKNSENIDDLDKKVFYYIKNFGARSLTIWGWNTRIYAESKLVSGTRETNAIYSLKKDFELHEYYYKRFIKDLKKNRPTLIIEDVDTSAFRFGEYSKYNLDNYPELLQFVNQNYNLVDKYGNNNRIYLLK